MTDFGHYLYLSSRSLRRSPLLFLQVVFTLAFGVAAFGATSGAFLSMSRQPVGERGSNLFHPQVDPRPLAGHEIDAEPPDDLTLADAEALLRISAPATATITSRNWLPLISENSAQPVAKMAITRAATRDFFRMFGAEFRFGSAWSVAAENGRANLVVLSDKTNKAIFNGENSVGRTLVIATKPFQVVGVLKPWDVLPRFYDLGDGAYADPEEIFMPFTSWRALPQDYGYGPMRCFGTTHEEATSDRCTWVQMWVQATSQQAEELLRRLRSYSAEQIRTGRFQRSANVRLRTASEWLAYKDVVPSSVRIQWWVSAGLLFACLLTASGLQVVTFRTRYSEFGVRRAMGASRRDITLQLIIESVLIGVTAGAVGCAGAVALIYTMRFSPEKYAAYLSVDAVGLSVAIVAALVAALLATIGPAVRASSVAPYRQLTEG
jgi:putative ABC transport system permease protein